MLINMLCNVRRRAIRAIDYTNVERLMPASRDTLIADYTARRSTVVEFGVLNIYLHAKFTPNGRKRARKRRTMLDYIRRRLHHPAN